MPCEVHWIIEGRLFYGYVSGDVSNDDVVEFNRINEEMLNSGVPLVHFILYDAELTSIPISLSTISKIITFSRNPRLGWAITVGRNSLRLHEFIPVTIARLANVRYRRVDTIRDALEFLKPLDSTLDWERVDYSVFPGENVQDL